VKLEEAGYKAINIERLDEGVVIVEFNRPEKLNAINQELHDDLHRLFRDIQHDATVRVAILTGAGRGFCAGGDVTRMDSPTGSGIARDWGLIHTDPSIIDDVLTCDKPVISMVNGPAVGLGATIALLSDLCIAAEDARIGDTHVSIGLVAGDGCASLMPLLVGPQRAKEFLLLGRLLTGREAADYGLINYAVPAAELREFTVDMATRIARQPPFSVRATKASVNRYVRLIADHVQDAALAWERLSMSLPEHHEAVKRFAARKRAE
jgi:enoyl-CoA hydratase